jgi:hypothetical protein
MVESYRLDSLYNHGHGVAIFWPLSDVRLALPIPWFAVAPFLRLTSHYYKNALSSSPVTCLRYSWHTV